MRLTRPHAVLRCRARFRSLLSACRSLCLTPPPPFCPSLYDIKSPGSQALKGSFLGLESAFAVRGCLLTQSPGSAAAPCGSQPRVSLR